MFRLLYTLNGINLRYISCQIGLLSQYLPLKSLYFFCSKRSNLFNLFWPVMFMSILSFFFFWIMFMFMSIISSAWRNLHCTVSFSFELAGCFCTGYCRFVKGISQGYRSSTWWCRWHDKAFIFAWTRSITKLGDQIWT